MAARNARSEVDILRPLPQPRTRWRKTLDAALPTIVLGVVCAGCSAHRAAHAGEDGREPARAETREAPASAPTRWLCRPDRASDPCVNADLSATELAADGSRRVIPHVRAAAPTADCFYVYPTVDLDLVPGNHDDLDDTRRVLATTLAQAGRFTETCALWVPLYRQVTLGTWLQPRPELERGLSIAFADVERAFVEYLAITPSDRRIVLVGHSQGAEMVVRLLRRFFDRDAGMRSRLLVAMAIGGELDVAEGATTGGTLAAVPVCTRPLETGCVVGYRTYRAGDRVEPGRWSPPVGRATVCVDPAALDRPSTAPEPHRLSRAFFPSRGEWGRALRGAGDVATPFVLVTDLYVASCTQGPERFAYLAVDAAPGAGDARGGGPVDLRGRRLGLGKLGLHVLDMQLTQGDLVDLVRRRVTGTATAAASGPDSPPRPATQRSRR